MAVDPYAPCPCGSGQKFKWCCQKVEAYAEKSMRLIENGQADSALATLDEGLRKAPGNPWLSVRKALLLIRLGRPAEARPLLASVLAAQPDHAGARGLMTRVVVELEGPEAGVGEVQTALAEAKDEDRPRHAISAQLVGVMLTDAGHVPAARKHLELAMSLGGSAVDHPELRQAQEMLEGNPNISPWLRNDDRLSPVPEGLNAELAERFQASLGLAEEGLWSLAAAGFQALAMDGPPEAERNLGLCRLWMADEAAAVDALRRYIRALGETTEAVDLEGLCQGAEPTSAEDLVDHVQLIWTLRDREALLATLRASDTIHEEGTEPIDPDDPDSFEVDVFQMLDRPKPAGGPPEDIRAVPRVSGRVLVGSQYVMLDTFDDGRLDSLSARFVELAGATIPPAQPRTKEIEKLPRLLLAMRSEWWLPEDVPEELARRLNRDERARLLEEVWPNTPMPYLKGRTPLQAGAAGDARVALRAAVCGLEISGTTNASGVPLIDFGALRARLNIAEEPEIGPEAEIETVHLARLHRVAAERLDDAKLAALYLRARRGGMARALDRAARAVIERPALLADERIGPLVPFFDLANLAAARGAKDEAADWFRRGREADPAARSTHALRWDLVELRLMARTEAPEVWVPRLAVILEQKPADRGADSLLLSTLVELGLVQMVPHPDKPDEMLLDTRPLQAVLAEYGPRITTASGGLGVSATQGGIWTPGSEGGTTSGGIWTPGGGDPAGGEKKLIIPGR
jgi:hypothetical protein